jgi:hypothetical protein
MDSLATFLRKHYGTLDNCADQLRVDRRTVYRWCSDNPTGLLKYMPLMVEQCNTTPTQIMGEVMFQEEILCPTGL